MKNPYATRPAHRHITPRVKAPLDWKGVRAIMSFFLVGILLTAAGIFALTAYPTP